MKCRGCEKEAKTNRLYCSTPCRYNDNKGDNNPAKRPDVKVRLSLKANEREKNPEYCKKLWQRNEYGWVDISCENCKKTFKARRCLKRRFCSNMCCTAFQTGINHPLYTGLNPETYGLNWKEQRDLARKRDNNCCQLCHKTKSQNGRNMDVHHKIPFKCFDDYEKANVIENLICLCTNCHRKQLRKLSYYGKEVETAINL